MTAASALGRERVAKKPFLRPPSVFAILAALVGLGLNGLLGWSGAYLGLFFYNIAFQFFCFVIAAPLGLHVWGRVLWPGETVYARYSRPRVQDLIVGTAAFLLALVNAGLAVWYVHLAGLHFESTPPSPWP